MVRGPRSTALARPDPEVADETGAANPALMARLSFLGLLVASVVVGCWGSSRVGPAAIWLGVAMLMVGLLVVARLLPMHSLGGRGWVRSLGEVTRNRRFWVLVVVTVSINICWHFLVSWLPTYLREERPLRGLVEFFARAGSGDSGRSLEEAKYLVSGLVTAAIFVAADAGNLVGGAVSRALAGRGLSPERARWRVMAAGALAIACGSVVGQVRGDVATLVLLAVMAFGAAAFMANYFAFCQEVDARHTGLVVGILGGLGNLFAAGIQPFAGLVKDRTNTLDPVFLMVGLSPFLGVAALLVGWRERSRRLGI
jgi:ACS family hexuronate transporter-like MFS transporter